MILAEKLAELFERRGFTHAFGIIGAGNVALYDAIARRGYTTIVCNHNEQASAQAATYYWRSCGKLAPVLPTTGGGSANVLTGLLAAWMDSIPLLVVSGNEPSRYFRDGTRVVGVQGYQSHQLLWVKWSDQLKDAEDLPHLLDFAIARAMEGRPGPAWLDIPRDLQTKEVA